MSTGAKKKIFAGAIIVLALIAIKVYQSPVRSGAVLPAYDSASSTPGVLRLVFFDVGQGDSSLIIAPNGDDILVDGGPDNSVVQKLGEYLPYADRKIEYIILTHPHADHIDGLNEVIRRYDVGKVIMTGVSYGTADYEEFLRLIEEKNIPTEIIAAPLELAVDVVRLSFLEPEKSFAGQKIANLNNSSIVFRLNFVSSSALFMGDFENEEELASTTDIKSEVLKVGHHGSTNASSEAFVQAVDPKFAVISSGAGNSYGHPHYRVLRLLQSVGAKIFRTDELGDVSFISDGVSFVRQP